MPTEVVLQEALELVRRLEQGLDQLDALALDDLFDGRLAELREALDEVHALLEAAEPEQIGPDDEQDDN